MPVKRAYVYMRYAVTYKAGIYAVKPLIQVGLCAFLASSSRTAAWVRSPLAIRHLTERQRPLRYHTPSDATLLDHYSLLYISRYECTTLLGCIRESMFSTTTTTTTIWWNGDGVVGHFFLTADKVSVKPSWLIITRLCKRSIREFFFFNRGHVEDVRDLKKL